MTKLTQMVRAGGCASKLPPGSLSRVLSGLPKQVDDNLLVGFNTADDAGVYRISSDLALVQTVDFFTPLVDDPFTFGRIAATNALSDVYAMGGSPLTALALVCFPEKTDLGILEEIMRGGLAQMVEAGCTVVGGHSVRDPEIKFGYAVTGTVHPDRVFTNTGAYRGDALILTKPIGTGVITTALKQGKAKDEWVETAVRSMTTLNRSAVEVIARGNFDVHGMTDVTGFGLIGHGREMALGSNVTLQIRAESVPAMDGALQAIGLGAVPGGLLSNREFAECLVTEAPGARIPEDLRTLLFDPQTSGGLLIAVASGQAPSLERELKGQGLRAETIGTVTEPQGEDGKTWAIRLV
ncbi:MAG: selenide, water dikinase SelD [Bryobacteraceae bacterium]